MRVLPRTRSIFRDVPSSFMGQTALSTREEEAGSKRAAYIISFHLLNLLLRTRALCHHTLGNHGLKPGLFLFV
jgi:hypothetical protein